MHGLIHKKPYFRRGQPRQMAWEVSFLKKIRSFDDGLTVFSLESDFSWYQGDHQPSSRCHLIILNYTIFEIGVYNIFHEEENAEI